MSKDFEIKTHVEELINDKFSALAHLVGLTKSELLRFIIIREVDGVLPQLKNNSAASLYGRAKSGLNEG